MSSNVQWFIALNKKPFGPLTVDDLESRISEGTLLASTKVWNSSMPKWVVASEVPEIEALRQVVEEKERVRKALPRWLVVVDKKVKREHEGPLSENDIEVALIESRFLDNSLFWKKGQAQWLTLDKISELVKVRSRITAAIALTLSPSGSPPALPDEPEIPPLHDDEPAAFQSAVILAETGPIAPNDEARQDNKGNTESSPQDDLNATLKDVFHESRWLATVEVFLLELEKGIERGDAIKIDGAVEIIRQFLLRESQSDRAPRHPSMRNDNLDAAANALITLVRKTEVKDRVSKFDPVFDPKGGSPSSIATRSRILMGAIEKRSFYHVLNANSKEAESQETTAS